MPQPERAACGPQTAEEGVAVERTHYLEASGRPFDLWVMRATNKKQMGEPREPERPDYSMFT